MNTIMNINNIDTASGNVNLSLRGIEQKKTDAQVQQDQ